MSILLRAEEYISNEQLLAYGDHIVAAVSGGPDSTAMLYMLTDLSRKWGFKLHVAHMDHGFRGEESRMEAEWVRQLAERLGWPCTIRHADIPGLAAAEHGNPQEVAREIRYKFLLDTASGIGAEVIALGHHADDQAETVLMKLLRGASLTGISGMSPLHRRDGVKLVRPMLRIYKEEILDYLHERGIEYCTDSSNADRKYTRNKLRLDVMPMLRSFNPGITHTLNRMADILRDEDRLLTRLAESEASRLFVLDDGAYTGSRDDLLKLDVALQRRVIKLILSYLCINHGHAEAIHIEQVREAIGQTASPSITLHLPGVTFMREYDQLRFSMGHSGVRTQAYEYSVSQENGRLSIAEAGTDLRFQTIAAGSEVSRDVRDGFGDQSAYFDMEEISFPLTVRNRRPGDRIQLLNAQGTTKLKDLFIDLKIPPSKRTTVPLVFDAQGRLLWVCGIRRSRHAPIHDTTRKVLWMKLEQNESMSSDIE